LAFAAPGGAKMLHKRSGALLVLIVANAWAIDSPNCAELRHPRYESVFTHSGPEAATNFLAINSRKSIMETTAHAQSHLRRHECLAYLTQAFIPASFGDML